MKYNYVVPMGDISSVNNNKLVPIRAEEEYIFDQNQKRFIDLRSGLWNVNLGYRKELYEAIQQQMNEQLSTNLTYLDIHSFHHPLYQEYAKKLCTFVDVDGSYTQLIYTNSGSECTDLALKLSRQINKKKVKTLAFSKGYHGTFWGGMSVSGLDQEVTQVYNPKLSNMEFIEFPENKSEEEELLAYIERHHHEYSAMIIEPILGSAGVKIPSVTFMNKLGGLLKQHDITIVFDEVATGFYRTGKRFFFHYLDFKPDMINLSKGINNGVLPFGTVLLSNELTKKLENENLEHFSTQNGNLLGIISANETLNYYQKNEVEVSENIKKLNEAILGVGKGQGLACRGVGCMFAITINNPLALQLIIDALEQAGILCYQYFNSSEDNGITLMPSYYSDSRKIAQVVKLIAKVVKSYA
ncbi:adenosylmethionine-8-amino-7-oxononanoate aminotransferase [Enterococcus sp. DIV0840]|uniref:aminotransferase class III-fold pyridoxal phosphate-dependent enzyme n=1 Tax=unclassified Enterococcus TaxID=2608891 RepID=UPI001A8E96F3|nr:aminotransferase class III-fold pyridoxal phosphate-dependent enzyme [Enterococcus sp. DIV0849a]MBO0434449.1 aminotransferase class III-fold pyridoxal phosphate-dependent enzyme [Enterococcus sp. DIV0849a]